MAITGLSIPYPDFEPLGKIDPNQIDRNNRAISRKINEVIDVINDLDITPEPSAITIESQYVIIKPGEAGVIGNGIANDTDAIEAIFAASSQKTFFFESGIYAVRSMLLSDGITIFGESGSVLRLLDGTFAETVLICEGNNNIRNLEFDGFNHGSNVGHALDAISCSNIYVDSCQFHDFDAEPISFDSVTHARIKNCTFDLVWDYAIHFTNCSDCLITNCRIERIFGAGISITGGSANNIIDCWIENLNHNKRGDLLPVYGIYFESDNGTIADNIVKELYTDAGFIQSGGEGIYIFDARNVNVMNNFVSNTFGANVLIQDSFYVNVLDNVLENSMFITDDTFREACLLAETSSNLNVCHNALNQGRDNFAPPAVFDTCMGVGNVFSYNKISKTGGIAPSIAGDSTPGVELYGSDNFEIRANRISQNYGLRGIHLVGSSFNLVKDNLVQASLNDPNAGDYQDYEVGGINISDNSEEAQNNQIMNNVIVGFPQSLVDNRSLVDDGRNVLDGNQVVTIVVNSTTEPDYVGLIRNNFNGSSMATVTATFV